MTIRQFEHRLAKMICRWVIRSMERSTRQLAWEFRESREALYHIFHGDPIYRLQEQRLEEMKTRLVKQRKALAKLQHLYVNMFICRFQPDKRFP